jgi:ATP-dependent helicase/nuclease subunit A
MSETLVPNEFTIARQSRASDPVSSIWVSANAGSGKTTVLARRVVRLLLAGVEPARILCLTFTKAAAANMANRVFRDLGIFATLNDAELDKELRTFGLPRSTPVERAQARRLFAQALDTPGGLKVLTLHAFCERVLHQFPLEAGVPADFAVLDDRQKAEIMARANQELFSALDSEPTIGNAMRTLLDRVSARSMEEGLRDIMAKPALLASLLPSEAMAKLPDRLGMFLGVEAHETSENLDAAVCADSVLRPVKNELIALLQSGSKTDVETAEKLAQVFSAVMAGADIISAYLPLFFRADGLPRAKVPVTKAMRDRRPDLIGLFDAESARIIALEDKRKAVVTREITLALLTLASRIYGIYTREKRRRGALDFDDLILSTRRLLQSGQSAWVLYKLDGGIDHVLVDEAQDTSPDQWAIIHALTAEFTAGDSARSETPRTVFAVGDEKQSIYSFQGASPDEFGTMRTTYERAHAHAGLAFEALELTQSFRSADAILSAVDHVFAQPLAHDSLESDTKPTQHQTARSNTYGRVEVWPLALSERRLGEDNAWDAPLDAQRRGDAVLVLAERIAVGLKNWIAGEHPLSPGERIAPGDVLILLRKRSALFNAIIRALKAQGLPVAGADRLLLGGHIVVMDMLALGDALLQEADDLQLASVLKSPLFGFDDTDLMALAPRRETTLRRALAQSPDPHHRHAAEQLDLWNREARALPPFQFYTHVLGRDQGRVRIARRFGLEAQDVLDEFQRLAMDYGSGEVPTLAGFLHWMRAADVEIKRDLDIGGGEIRVMTVHGAKGLEAGVVILADSGPPPTTANAPRIVKTREQGASEAAPDLAVWVPGKKLDSASVLAARELEMRKAEAEHRRLLYVALTRAQDRLVIVGHARVNKDGAPNLKPLSWYELVRTGLQDAARPEHVQALGGEVLVFETLPASPAVEIHQAEAMSKPDLPAWLFRKVSDNRPEWQAVAPSGAGGANPEHVRRGNTVHKLLHILANKSGAQRAAYLQNEDPQIAAEVGNVLDDPRFSAIFGPSSRSEVDIAADITVQGATFPVRGRIDRLVVEKEVVLVVDFKTETQVPDNIPEKYTRQLSLYKAALAQIFPQSSIRAAVLWTRNCRLDMVPEGTSLDT